jgi:hypothetical protein
MAYIGAIETVDITIGIRLPGGLPALDLPYLGHVVITYDPKGYCVLIAPLLRLVASCRIEDGLFSGNYSDRFSRNFFVENEEKKRVNCIRYDHFGDGLGP